MIKNLLLLWLSMALLGGCGGKTEPVHNAKILAFGTLIDVSIVGETRPKAEAAVERLELAFQEMHKKWHAWETSPLTQTNQLIKQNSPFSVPAVVLPLLQRSITLAEQSENLFNPAIGGLINLWGFQGKEISCDNLPNADQINTLLRAKPKLSNLALKGDRIQDGNPAIKLDFGAVGKGYGIDQAISLLQEMDIPNALVNAGGDLRAIGSRQGRPWRIAIRHPNGGVFGMVEVSGDESVFTSGDYERNLHCDSRPIHHIIDPRTGYPATGTHSVTVIHSDATTADAAATALFIAGPSDWHRIAVKMGIHYVALLDDKGTLHINPKMKQRLTLLNPDIKILVSKPLTGH
jgi:thiamine biosynthesis lipoprotein